MHALNIIDPVISWFQIYIIPEIDMLLEQILILFHYSLLYRYEELVQITYNNRSELKKDLHALWKEYELN